MLRLSLRSSNRAKHRLAFCVQILSRRKAANSVQMLLPNRVVSLAATLTKCSMNKIADGMNLPRFLWSEIDWFFWADIVRVAMLTVPKERPGNAHRKRMVKGAVLVRSRDQHFSEVVAQANKRLPGRLVRR